MTYARLLYRVHKPTPGQARTIPFQSTDDPSNMVARKRRIDIQPDPGKPARVVTQRVSRAPTAGGNTVRLTLTGATVVGADVGAPVVVLGG